MLFPAVAVPGGSHGDLPLPALPPSKTRDAILRSAQRLMGTPYVFGGESAKGIDCSGLVYLVFKEATGRTVPRTVDTLGPWVLLIPRQELKAGDLVFFNLNSTSSTASRGSSPSKATLAAADHVGIYAGDNEFYHAASAGSRTGVIKTPCRSIVVTPLSICRKSCAGLCTFRFKLRSRPVRHSRCRPALWPNRPGTNTSRCWPKPLYTLPGRKQFFSWFENSPGI
jgi:cell wall-associated NlpC family hydrolase